MPIGCELVRGYSTASSTAGSSAASYSTRPTILAYTPSATPGTTRVTWSPRYPTLSCPGVVHEACNGCTTPVLRSRNPPDSLTSSSFPHRCTLCEDASIEIEGVFFFLFLTETLRIYFTRREYSSPERSSFHSRRAIQESEKSTCFYLKKERKIVERMEIRPFRLFIFYPSRLKIFVSEI